MVDPDGFEFEMEQFTPEQPTTAPADGKVLGASLGTTLADAEKSAVFYKALGFDFRLGNAFNGDNPVGMALVDAEGGQLRASGLTIPGPKTPIFCFEFRGLDQLALPRNIRDPGASAITLQVHDVDAAIQAAKATGGSVIASDGKAVTLKDGKAATKGAWVKSPDGLLLELLEKRD